MNRRLTFVISPEQSGKTIREFLREELAFSAHQISRLKFQEDGIRVDEEKAYVSHVLREGEVLTVGLTEQVLRRDTEGGKPAKIWEPPDPALAEHPLKVLYEDEDYLIVDKPTGMVCHPSPGHYSDTLANQAAAYLGGTGTAMDMRVTGRLDRETSGIVTFARSTEAAAMIQRQRADGRLVKTYLALAEGIFAKRSFQECADAEGTFQPADPAERDLWWANGVVDVPLRREYPGSHRMICAQDGKPARTFYRVLGETTGPGGSPRTLLAVRIEHGRTHQIRVHMAHIGHPLTGDLLYGVGTETGSALCGTGPEAGNPLYGADKEADDALRGAGREPMGLHAYKLSFWQPFKAAQIDISAEIPLWADIFHKNVIDVR